MKYPDPNAPLDKNIQDSIRNLDNAEQGLGKKLDLLARRIDPNVKVGNKMV